MDEYNETLRALGAASGISALAALSRTVLSSDRRSFMGFLRGLILATFVGSLTFMLIQDYNISSATQGGVVGVAAFVADDLLVFLLAITTNLTSNPKAAADFILSKFRVKK